MGNRMRSVYAGLASRFAHLALGAKEEDEEDKDGKEARAEEERNDEEDDGDEEEASARADEQDGDGDDDEDEDEDDEEAKRESRKAAAQARSAERARWAAVMSSAEAKGRVPLACSLLADTSMSAEKVRAALLASPVESRQGLAARMATVPRPDVGSAPSAGAAALDTPASRAESIVKAYNKATGGR